MYRVPPCSTCHPVRLELEQLRADVAQLQADRRALAAALARQTLELEAQRRRANNLEFPDLAPFPTTMELASLAARRVLRREARQERRRAAGRLLGALGGLLSASAAKIHAGSADHSPGAVGGRLALAPPAPVSQRQGLYGGGLVFSTENTTTPETGSP